MPRLAARFKDGAFHRFSCRTAAGRRWRQLGIGLLAAGLGIGYLRSVRPTFGRLPEATSWWLMEFGLLLFMAGVGLSAGGKFIETLTSAGPLLVLAGAQITRDHREPVPLSTVISAAVAAIAMKRLIARFLPRTRVTRP